MVAITMSEQMYATEFERAILSEIEGLVKGLPAGTANYRVGPSRHDPGMVAPTFEIRPTNPAAACISGAVISGAGITVSVGHSCRELWTSETSASEASECARIVLGICRAVFAGNFTEHLRMDRSGKRISSSLCLRLDNGDFRMWRNRLIADLFKFGTKREIRYEPYYK